MQGELYLSGGRHWVILDLGLYCPSTSATVGRPTVACLSLRNRFARLLFLKCTAFAARGEDRKDGIS